MTPLGKKGGSVAWVFGNDFDVDQVVGVANIKVQDVSLQAPKAMAQFEEGFHTRVKAGDFLVAGRNFGYGHPHAIAMRTMRHLGIAGVVAESFFCSFWIGELGYGFHLLVCPGIQAMAHRGDELSIDWDRYIVTNVTTGQSLPAQAHTARERLVLAHGGLKPMLAAQARQ